ncbi:MAG: glycine--tRNA ligase subunit beta, partial [Actinobacteria bacterium]
MSRDLVFEIGVEEIPSAPLYAAIEQLKTDASAALKAARLGYEHLETHGAPRRLTLYVTRLAERSEDLSERVKGPAAKAAFDADGKPTKAAEGFARSRGIDVAALELVEGDDGAYVYATVEQPGRAAAEVLPGLLAGVCEGIDWPKSMRWGSGETRFVRPVRWLAAVLGDDVVPVEFAGLTAGRATYGHRFLTGGPIEIASAEQYSSVARIGLFVYDQAERARLVREGVDAAAVAAGGRAVVPEKTFAEVVNLVEWPTVVTGHFDTDFLEVPREVLETAMESHQRYFPVETADGALTNAFIVAHNGDPERSAEIVAGHERVIRARLADATFFYREDLKSPLEANVARLDTIVFQEKLGTLGRKVARMEALAGALADLAGADAGVRAEAVRAAHLAKADLVSHVVVEMPALQGVMGRYYALASGEGEAVATAIVEHYRPRFAGDQVPSTAAGRLASAADKLDTIVGIFAIGQGPTGAGDPFALRRAALGILAMVTEGGLAVTLDAAIAAAIAGCARDLPGLDAEETGAEVKAFFIGRLEGLLKDRGFAYDTVDAVLATAGDDPADALRRCHALQTARDSDPETFDDLATAFTRAKNLAQADLGTQTDDAMMTPPETALATALAAAEATVAGLVADGAYPEVLAELAAMRAP